MSTELDITQPEGALVFDQSHSQLIADQIAPGASPAEIEVFLYQCANAQLDPFRNQIWLVGRYDYELKRKVFKAQTSIDGLRLIAQRTGQYAGTSEPQWCDASGVWSNIWLHDYPPAAARISVERKDWERPAVGVVLYREFVQTKKDGNPTMMWREKGVHMLAKCAEAQALRKAFPAETSGLYTDDEMPEVVEVEREAPPSPDVSAVFDRFMPLVPKLGDVAAFKEEARAAIEEEHGPFEDFTPASMSMAQAEMMLTLAANLAANHVEPVEAEQVDAEQADEPDDPVDVLAKQFTRETLEGYAGAMGADPRTLARNNRGEILTLIAETEGQDVETMAAHIKEWAGQ